MRCLPTLFSLSLLAFGACAPGTTSSHAGDDQHHGSGTLTPTGGSLDLGPVQVRAADGAALDDVDVVARRAALPAPLPGGLTSLAEPVAIELTRGREALALPLALTFAVPSARSATQVPFVARYEAALDRYEPTSLLSFDATSVTVDSRAGGVFVPVLLDLEPAPQLGPTAEGFRVPGFNVSTDSWSIDNFGQEHLAPGGNCLGMAAFCRYFLAAPQPTTLAATYRGLPARLVALRAHIACSQVWGQFLIARSRVLDVFSGSFRPTGLLMKAILRTFQTPLIALLSAGKGRGAHAGIVFGWDDSGFLFYDVNFARRQTTLPFDDTDGFGTYQQYHEFGYIALSSVGGYDQFATIVAEAEDGFRSDAVTITEPSHGAALPASTATVKGTVTDGSWDTAILFVNGVQWFTPIRNRKFETRVPLRSGDNSITVLAGTGLQRRSLFASDSGVQHVEVESTLPPAALKAALSWDQNNADVDLYVREPGGDVAWFRHKRTGTGGVLDIDNRQGYGPEHYTTGPGVSTGRFRVRVHYYSDKNTGQRATGKVSLLLHEGTPQQAFQVLPFTITRSDNGNADPSDRGADWFEIGEVDLSSGTVNR